MTDPEVYSAPHEPSDYALEFRSAEEWHALHQAQAEHERQELARQRAVDAGDLDS
jgi:hypothetical protein